jgi:endonuclease YncB( thermonuclease family)
MRFYITVALAGLFLGLLNIAVRGEGIEVVDGDTVRVKTTVFRLVGYDTPELGSLCPHERYMAQKAKDRLAQLIRDYDHTLTPVNCACPPGTQGTRFCNYGRSCAILTIEGGLNVAETLIRDRLARRYDCTFNRCPRREPWC